MTAATAALVLVLLSLAAPASGQPAPLTVLDVPFISQSEALCGGAAAAMVMRYWGARGVSAESFARLVDPRAGGISTSALVADLSDRGWDVAAVSGTDSLVRAELDRGRPVLALIEDRPGAFHYVVIVASTPRAVVFHDPARTAYRVMSHDAFTTRWVAAGTWMAIVVPTMPFPESPAPRPALSPVRGSCEALVADGIEQAQSNAFEAAERSLTAALSCGGAAPLRELAGLRLLQRRWPEVTDLASAALAVDPMDAHAWELLATSRFVQDDTTGSLQAWNRIDQPRIDLVAVDGLTRSRQRVVERLLDVPANALLTPRLFTLTARRLQELPSADSTRLELVPVSSGLAELRAHVAERALVPSGLSTYAVMGVLAAARNEVALSMGAFTGGGERLTLAWRFWPERPRVRAEYVAPAPWGGVWGVDAFAERQPFDADRLPAAHRRGAGMTMSHWVGPWARVSVRGGIDRWDARGTYGAASSELRLASSADRVRASLSLSGWAGADRFASFAVEGRVRSRIERLGRVFVGRAGAAATTAFTPPDLWFGGDTGRTRDVLLRAHPIVAGGHLRADQMGGRIAHASAEVRQWRRTASPIGLGVAAFLDGATVGHGLGPAARTEVDVGVGARVAVPGLDGVFRIDLGKGLRDGATAVSLVYEP